jgi:hypothetical protein
MACNPPVFLRTFDASLHGVRTVVCAGDGYTVALQWYKEYIQPRPGGNTANWDLFYNIYWSTNHAKVYDEGVKLIVRPNTKDQFLSLDIFGAFNPGRTYYFAVKGAAYESGTLQYDQLLDGDPGSKIAPEAVLVQDMTATDNVMYLDDVAGFPPTGIVKIGDELILYSHVDVGTLKPKEHCHHPEYLVFPNLSGLQRGYLSDDILTTIAVISDGYTIGNNVGNGYISNLSVIDPNSIPQTWKIFCSLDGSENDGYAKFAAIGSLTGSALDGYGDPVMWNPDGVIVSNGIFSFAIQNGTVPFKRGDYFLVQLDGYVVNGGPGGARPHTVDGYDGHHRHHPFVRLWEGWQDINTAIGMVTIRFDEQYARTNKDGFRERTDILSGTSNLNVVDVANAGFPAYDQAGWDRTFLPDWLSGKCVGSYFGGEYGCSDGSECDGAVRGLSVQEHMDMREEYLLQVTGERVVLFRRMWAGKQSRHTSATRENTTYRGTDTYGTSLVTGYEQYFNPRESDGKILVRFGPTKEDFKREDVGIENSYIANCWTLVTPTIKDGDFIIRFNQDGTEEWRYEIIDVDRNRTMLFESGAQKFTAIRVRKTDPICQVRSIRDTSTLPSEILTSIGMVMGPGGLPAHMHRIVLPLDKINHVHQINQLTSVDQGHNHPVISGEVSVVLGHTHKILPSICSNK